ncbi:hypothetical protein M9458_026333, partial [Cirrhinus mrigala]
MNDHAVLVLLLEQGERSLEDHTMDFVFFANSTHYPDRCLCLFYQAGVNTTTRAQLLATYIEWVLRSAQPAITPLRREAARAHRWQRARASCDRRAIAEECLPRERMMREAPPIVTLLR